MDCQLTLRADDTIKQWTVDEWTSLVAIAVLSAEPKTEAEWYTAMRRYQPDHELEQTGTAVRSLDEASADGPWCLIDLDAMTVVAGGGYDLPDRQGAYEPSENEEVQGFPIVWLDTPADWQFVTATPDWQIELARRIAAARQAPGLDVRAVLFGRPLFEFLTDETLAAATSAQNGNRKQQQEMSSGIHARWLLTPRVDLGGKTPREVLLADRRRIQSDLEHRSEQWTRQNAAPIGLPTTSNAYRHGGFGTTENVLYFDLVRSLLDKAWKLVDGRKCTNRSQVIERLADHCDGWLNQPYEGGESAAELIDLERQRMPMVSNGAHFDCDCPICRAEAEGMFGSAPMFMWFDGHHLELENEFAFSLYEDESLWRLERQERDEFDRQLQSEASSSQDADHAAPVLPDSVWETSYVDWNHVTSGERSTQESMFALAFPVAELISYVKIRARGRPHVDSLNQAYDQLRRATDPITARSAAGQLCDTLEGLAHAYPDLLPRCADLQSHIDEVVRRFR